LNLKLEVRPDDLEPRHLRQRVEDLLADAVGEVLLRLLAAHVDEGQHGDGLLVDRGRGGGLLDGRRLRPHRLRHDHRLAPRRQHDPVEGEVHQRQRQHRDDHAIHAARGLRCDRLVRRHLRVALDPVRRELEHPAEDQRRHEADRNQDHDAARQPLGCAEHRQHRSGDLRDQPCADQVQPCHADDVAAPELGYETHGLLTAESAGSGSQAKSFSPTARHCGG
jgi:hypothetical protein